MFSEEPMKTQSRRFVAVLRLSSLKKKKKLEGDFGGSFYWTSSPSFRVCFGLFHSSRAVGTRVKKEDPLRRSARSQSQVFSSWWWVDRPSPGGSSGGVERSLSKKGRRQDPVPTIFKFRLLAFGLIGPSLLFVHPNLPVRVDTGPGTSDG